jgi:hypothetical protein
MFQTFFYILGILYSIYCVSFCLMMAYTLWKEHKEEQDSRIQREYDLIRYGARNITMTDLGKYEQVLDTIPEEYMEV